MNHLIEKIKIKNFKSCIDTELLLSDYTPLVGYNNAGKSNCLTAINWLLKKKKLDESFFNSATSELSVEADIVGITPSLLSQMTTAQQRSISPFLYGTNNEKLTIIRKQALPSSPIGSITISVWDDGVNDWTPNPTGIDNALKAILPEPIRIGAMENAAEDAAKAKNTTTIGKLLSNITEEIQATHANQIQSHLDSIASLIASDGASRLTQLHSIDQSINDKVQDLFPDISVKLHFPTPTEEDLLTSGTIKVLESGSSSERDFGSYGHGAQRSIQMGLVRHLADVSNPTSIATKLLLIDEPELYLHPFGIEQIREALLNLSMNGYQIIFSTHSANMITAEEAPKTLLIRKRTGGTYARVRLSDAIQTVVADSTHQMEQLFSLSHSSHVLFSEKVVLTEGKTELRLLPYIYKEIKGKTMGIDKCALVAQSGVGDTKKSMSILNAMDLPSKAICDLDFITKVVKNGYLPQNNPDIAAIKVVFQNIASVHGMTLTNQHWPQNTRGGISAAESFEKLAVEPTAIPHIQNLHDELKQQGIWLWKLGAIEAYLGLSGKDEAHWAQFKTDVRTDGITTVCPHYQGLEDLINWL
ncbi:ATP-dependent endonuclease [Vibrio splendidus]